MLFANFFEDLLGQACFMFFVICAMVGWVCSSAAKSKTVRKAAKISFWSWFFWND